MVFRISTYWDEIYILCLNTQHTPPTHTYFKLTVRYVVLTFANTKKRVFERTVLHL